MDIVLTFGTFDLFHPGHVKILQRAKALGKTLIVGLSTDELNYSKKSRYPIYTFNQRKLILESMKCVDHVFPEESLELKEHYIKAYRANILVMGDDWKGKFDQFKNDELDVVYLERTADISTTYILQKIKNTVKINVPTQ